MRVDAHMHVNYKGLDAGGIVSYLDREGLNKCWLLTWEEASPKNPLYMSLPVDEVFDAYRGFPDRVCPMYAPDPYAPDAAQRFLSWVDRGACGCGELKTSLSWDSPKLDRLLDEVDKLKMPLVFHMEKPSQIYASVTGGKFEKLMAKMLNTARYRGYPRKTIEFIEKVYGPLSERKERMRHSFPGYMTDFAALETRLAQFPDIRFVGHGPLFWAGVSSAGDTTGAMPHGTIDGEGITCRLMDEYDNLYADLSARSGYSALTRDREFARGFITRHSARILYGTDNFFLGLRKFLDSLGLSEDDARLVYGKNASRMLGGSSD